MTRFESYDATALRAAILAGELSAEQATRAALEAAESRGTALGAFLHVEGDAALARARALDARSRTDGEPGALFGVPVALKANMCLAGSPASCGSRILEGWRAPYDATFVERLLDAGAVPIGATNMDEFAMGSSCENSAFGVTRNPWDVSRTPGGSSGGSAAAVAAGIVPIALGSDTGGSVRQPAALCGTLGFKPTYGRVSRYGLIAYGSSLDQVSPFARSGRDLERVMGVISGADGRDSTCIEAPPLAIEPAPQDLTGLRVGVPAEYFPTDLDAGVRSAVEAGIDELRTLGAEVHEVRLPHTRYAIPTYYVVATAEASSNLARYDGVRYATRATGDGSLQGMIAATREAGFGDEVKLRILLGTYVLSSGYYDAWYGKASRVRTLIARDFETAFGEVDVIACPTSPSPAFALGEKTDDPVAMYLSDVMTVPASLAGLPAASVPCGALERDGRELPVGLQLIGAARDDAGVLGCARALQEARGPVAIAPMEGAAR
ncbi:MAG: Asp-tRNA(Asn)/Glu-tRNA(Gln) amidotransferase subunit GatA [bacterium]|nr:Asp-tRNA(Asn)/Glu-tRNA(Gln) amidotransferase subunit GatA [bacterium]